VTQREKVIKGLKHCIGDNCSGDKWYECEYSGHGCIDALLEDAFALLKAQEPVKPTWRWDYAYCGECGFHLHWMVEKNNYCPECGRAVKWE
jgi:hypothetical protein